MMIRSLLIVYFASVFSARADVAVPTVSLPPAGDELAYEVEAIKACLARYKPPKEYQQLAVLPDNGECKQGSDNSAEGGAAPAYRRVDPKKLPVTTGSEKDFNNLKLAIKNQLGVCEHSSDLARTFSLNVQGTEIKLTKRRYCVETNKKLLQLASSSTSYAEFMKKARSALNWYTPAKCSIKPSLATGFYSPDFEVYHDPSEAPDPKNVVPILRKPPDHRYVKVQACEQGRDDGYRSCRCIGNCAPVGADRSNEVIQCPYLDREALTQRLPGMKGDDGGSLVLGYMDAAHLTDGQLEGSWTGEFPGGSSVSFKTDGNNGHPNYFLGRISDCIKEKMIDSNEKGRNWSALKDNEKALFFLNTNYAFATERPGGPAGTSGTTLHGYANVAVDPSVTPLGAAVLYNIIPKKEDGSLADAGRESRMSIAGDTGSAIKGPCRIDVFTGIGAQAGQAAGTLKDASWLFLGVVK